MTELTQLAQALDATGIGKWRAYPSYKDSGVEWLGKIPEHWEVKSVKHLAGNTLDVVQTGPFGAQLHASDYIDEGIPLILIRNVNYLRIDDTNIPKISLEKAASLSSYRLQVGDIVFSRVGSIGRVALVSKREEGWLISGQMLRLRINNPALYNSFAIYYLCSDVITRFIDLRSVGSTRESLNTEILRNISIELPPLSEQHAIVSFLDLEVEKISTLIAKKQRLSELLQEKRAALISHAVTKGLDPDAKMKDSGVEWLGEIPEHWEVRRLKFVGIFYSGGTPSKENLEYWSGDIPWVSPKDMKYEIIHDTEDHITAKAIEDSSTRLVQTGAVLIVVRSGILRHTIPVGIKAIPVAINQDMKVIVLKPFLKAEYLASVIRGHQGTLLVEWRKEGTTVESIEFELLVNTSCPVPPKEEQQAIISYLERETTRIDALVSRVGEAIEKLKEYSAALISAAVTGKIDVRDEVAILDEADLGD